MTEGFFINYKNRMLVYGSNQLDSIKKHNRQLFASSIKDAASYYKVCLIPTLISNEEIFEDALVNDNSNIRDEKMVTLSSESVYDSGYLVKYKNEYWLTVHFDNMQDIYKRGIIRKCYTTLKWQDEDGIIQEAWFSKKTDVSPNFGVGEGRVITLPDERRQIIVQSNVHTQKLRKFQRFIFDGRAWKILTSDDTAEGIINIVLAEDQINPATDNVVLRVANYKNIVYSLDIMTNDNTIVNLNQPFQLDIRAYKDDQSISINEINLSSSDEAIGNVNMNGLFTPLQVGIVDIIAEYKGIEKKISIEVTETYNANLSVYVEGNFQPYFEIKNNQQKIYTAKVLSGVTIVDSPVEFELFSDDKISSTTLASIIQFDSASCTIKNNKVSTGYVQLKVSLQDDPSIVNWYRIQMKPLF